MSLNHLGDFDTLIIGTSLQNSKTALNKTKYLNKKILHIDNQSDYGNVYSIYEGQCHSIPNAIPYLLPSDSSIIDELVQDGLDELLEFSGVNSIYSYNLVEELSNDEKYNIFFKGELESSFQIKSKDGAVLQIQSNRIDEPYDHQDVNGTDNNGTSNSMKDGGGPNSSAIKVNSNRNTDTSNSMKEEGCSSIQRDNLVPIRENQLIFNLSDYIKIPQSKTDLLNIKNLSLRDKKHLAKILGLIGEIVTSNFLNKDSESTIEKTHEIENPTENKIINYNIYNLTNTHNASRDKNEIYKDFMKLFENASKTVINLIQSICFIYTPINDYLKNPHCYSALEAFGKSLLKLSSPIIFSRYGPNDISAAYCRKSAVYGGLYILNSHITEITENFVKIQHGEEILTCNVYESIISIGKEIFIKDDGFKDEKIFEKYINGSKGCSDNMDNTTSHLINYQSSYDQEFPTANSNDEDNNNPFTINTSDYIYYYQSDISKFKGPKPQGNEMYIYNNIGVILLTESIIHVYAISIEKILTLYTLVIEDGDVFNVYRLNVNPKYESICGLGTL